MHPKPLNPALYDALDRVFGHVEIVSPGDVGFISHSPNWYRGGKPKADVQGGEFYKVSCKFCSDTRKRLWFNYRWGVRDEKSGSDMLHLAICYNDDCINTRRQQERLRDMLFRFRLPMLPDVSASAKSVRRMTPPIQLPCNLVPITDEERAADGRLDLEERSFDLDELWKRWRVFYCPQSDNPPPTIQYRIVIPIYGFRMVVKTNENVAALMGWQARAIEPVGQGEPKYLSAKGMRKSALLYGLTAAVDCRGPVVVCEGPTDVWRLGVNGVALFGKDISDRQSHLLARYLRRRPVVVFLDRDAAEQAKKVARRITSAKRASSDEATVVIARPPKGCDDVGDCTRQQAWKQIAKALGVSLRKLKLPLDRLPEARHPDFKL